MGFSLARRLLLLFGAAAFLASCGGGSSSSTSTTPATITANPTSLSMDHGQVTSAPAATVFDSTGTALTTQPTFTYSSSDPAHLTVTSTGQVCAGIFDANNIVCQIQPDVVQPNKATANLLISGDGLTATVPVFIHPHVQTVTVSGPANPPFCLSQNQTEQFTAKAFENINGAPIDITSQVGAFTWSTGNNSIATVDANGVVTSRQPGATTVVATVTNTTGTPEIVVDCPPKTITVSVSGGTSASSFNVATGTSQTLTATVIDVLGQPIANAPITFASFDPALATVTTSGAVTTPGAGITGIVASCAPPGCNPASGNVNTNGTGVGLAIYSNLITGTITGSTVTTVYVTGADNPDGSANTSLIPITISTNTAGTAITLQGSPNSMVFNRAGTTAYIGTNNTNPTVGLLIFDAASNTVTATASGITGKVLSVSNDGNTVIISDTTNTPNKVFVYNAASNTVQEFDVAGVTAADFNSDNSKAYLTAGSTIYEFSTATATFKPLTFAADGVVFTPQGSVAYFGDSSIGGTSILGIATCNDVRVDNAAGVANILGITPDGTHMIGAGANGWVDLSYTVNNANGCPPTASNTVNATGFGAAFVGTPTQIAVASNDSFTFLTSYTGGSAATGVPFYQFATASAPPTTGTIPLAGGGGTLFSGSITPDATSLYVGVGNSVHRIDLTKSPPVDSNQTSVAFNPRLVVVRPQ